jgi:hypothetical protein
MDYYYENDEIENGYKPLDNDWINEFEKIDKDYQDFYNEDLQFLKIHSIYISQQNQIEQIKEEKLFFNDCPNKISREYLLGILKNNAFNCGKRYSILSILKYNINLQSSDIKDYIRTKEPQSFLSLIKNIDDIVFEQTINMFQDLNDLILVFYEKNKEEQKNAGLQRSHTAAGAGSLTKKIYIHSNYGAVKKHRHTNKYRKTT